MALRVLTALALFIDAGVHIHLAPGYQAASPDGIGQSNLFYLESAAAVLVALSAFAAVMVYRYVDIPALGPFPEMYDPVWFFEKSLSAAEGAGALLAVIALLRTAHQRRADAPRRSAPSPTS
ncbi:UNVERIFIED_ORG: hypothetical protein ABIB13_003056 [Arthrobacter sp. UYEF2]